MKPKLVEIQQFTSQKHIAVAGVSRNDKKFGNEVFKHLQKIGYQVYPVNPHMEIFQDQVCYPNPEQLPEAVTALHINTKPDQTKAVVESAHRRGIHNIWIQQGATNKEAYAFAKEKGMNVISGQCIFMFTEPVSGPHKFHRFLKKTFGLLPK